MLPSHHTWYPSNMYKGLMRSDGVWRPRSSSIRSVGVQQLQADLAGRVREVREDLYGEHGAQFLADALGLPLGTWANYERGVTIPAVVILQLIDATGVSPGWLLSGHGPKYHPREREAR